MSAVLEADNALLLRTDAEGVATLTLNRPGQFNSLSEELLTELQAELDAIAVDDSVRVVVIAGAGKAFCAGHDLKQMRANHRKEYMQGLFRQCGADDDCDHPAAAAGDRPRARHRHGGRLPAGGELRPGGGRRHGAFRRIGHQRRPVLLDAGGGARPATWGASRPWKCCSPATSSMPQEAQRRGLVNRVVPADQLDAEVSRLTESICAKSAAAVRMGKQLFYQQIEMGVDAAYQLAAETMACNMMCDDAAEGIDAFMQKRKPEWKGR